jgi:adenine phosphoribosyltransferase
MFIKAGATNMTGNDDLRALVRTIPDYPKPGIQFRDVSTLLLDGPAFRQTIDRMIALVDPDSFDLIAGIEARGFIVSAAMSYALEYGTDRIEMHNDAIQPGQRVLLVDDLIATGGTALAGVELLRGQGAIVEQALFIVDLPDLGGAQKLAAAGVKPTALMAFAGD